MRGNRSHPQSAYRWTVIVRMIREHWNKQGFNYTPDQVNLMMKLATGHYIEIIEMPWGEKVKRELPTSKSTPQEFEQWLDDVRTWAYEKFDLDVPTPNSVPVKYYND